VVVEDVRERRRAVVSELVDVGIQIEAWLAKGSDPRPAGVAQDPREDSVSPAP
jgi:hypothetical protein